jgi:hypothetical protein
MKPWVDPHHHKKEGQKVIPEIMNNLFPYIHNLFSFPSWLSVVLLSSFTALVLRICNWA